MSLFVVYHVSLLLILTIYILPSNESTFQAPRVMGSARNVLFKEFPRFYPAYTLEYQFEGREELRKLRGPLWVRLIMRQFVLLKKEGLWAIMGHGF
jgi:hypothetical protein